MNRPIRWLAAFGAVAVVCLGGAALTLAEGSGTIRACVAHHGGTLYRASRCKRHDRRLTWSIQGPRGPRGAPGARGTGGTDGTNGTNGQGPGYAAYDNGPVAVPANTSYTNIVTLNIPTAGSYVISAKVEATRTTAGGIFPACTLTAGSDTDTSNAVASNVGAANAFVMLPLQVAHTFSAPGSVVLACSGDNTPVSYTNAKVAAIQLTSLSNAAVSS